MVEWLAFGASAIALIVSVLAARYAKQQADAAHGRLPPTIEMRIQRRDQYGRWVDLHVRNPGAETAYVTKVEFSAPQVVTIMHKSSPERESLKGPAMSFAMGYPVPISPLSQQAKPMASLFRFMLQNGGAEEQGGFDLTAIVYVRIGNARRQKKIKVFQPVLAKTRPARNSD